MNNKAVAKNIEKRSLLSRIAGQAYLWLLLVVLYAPILLIIIFSFTKSKVFGNWTGFTFGLYENLLVVAVQPVVDAEDRDRLIFQILGAGRLAQRTDGFFQTGGFKDFSTDLAYECFHFRFLL